MVDLVMKLKGGPGPTGCTSFRRRL